MPTGYTCYIYEDVSFEDWALKCARAFGALIHMRDDSSKKEITLPKASTHHQDSLTRATDRLKILQNMTDEQKLNGMKARNEESWKSYQDRLKEKEEKRKQLDNMLLKARDWVPPTPDHNGLREFMISQIQDTIKWDCGETYKPTIYASPEEWHRSKVESEQESIEYHQKYIKDDKGRNDNRRQWIIDLFESLGQGERVKTLKESEW